MATHESAEKKYRRDEKRKMINKMNRSKMRNKIKLFRAKIKAGEVEEAQKMFPEVIASIDKTISKGTIHQNTGARYKSRLNVLLMKTGAKT
jgi:small subunit ribosomal protein S20